MLLADIQAGRKSGEGVEVKIEGQNAQHFPRVIVKWLGTGNARYALFVKNVGGQPDQVALAFRLLIKRTGSRIVSRILLLAEKRGRAVGIYIPLNQQGLAINDPALVDAKRTGNSAVHAGKCSVFVAVTDPAHPRIGLNQAYKLARQSVGIFSVKPRSPRAASKRATGVTRKTWSRVWVTAVAVTSRKRYRP